LTTTPSLAWQDKNADLQDDGPRRSPIQIFRQLIKEPNTNAQNELNRIYWQLLSLATFKKRALTSELTYSFPDRLHFDFGIWCGEQFFGDPEVQDFLKDFDGPPDSAWPIIYEECCEQIKNWNIEAPLYTITSWLQHLDKQYRLCAEAENFVIPPEVLKQLPQSANRYIYLRDERRKILEKLKVFMQKAPGFHEKLVHLLASGGLHDQIDFMKARPRSTIAEQKSLAQVNQLWEDCSAKLRRLFQHPQIIGYFDKIEMTSNQIQQLIVRYKIDVNSVLNEAKNLYLQQTSSQKRLNRDLMLLKNNLNMGSMKNSQKLYHAMPKKWPQPINLDDFTSSRQQCFKFDRWASHKTPIIFVPGLEKGFYEFDQSAIILPLYGQNTEDDYLEAMAERFYTTATLKNNTELLADFDKICSEEKKNVGFKSLYLRWIKDALKPTPQKLNPAEFQFALKYIAPPLEQLFLRDEECNMDQQQMIDLITRWKQHKLPPQHHRQVAAIFYAKERYKEAAKVLSDLALIFPNQPQIEIAMLEAYEKANQIAERDNILNKWSQEKNLGYYGKLVNLGSLDNANEP
jgi:hypothetical protein